MVTSTSTPASMLTMICLTISVGAWRLCDGWLVDDPDGENTARAGAWQLNLLDEALVDAELEQIPGLGTLTARSLAGHDLEGLGGQADGTLDAEVLGLGAVDELGADLLEGLDLAGGQGDADAVSLGGLAVALVALLVRRHLDWSSFGGW